MKSSLLLLLALLCSVQMMQGQVIDSTMTESKKEMYDFYLDRSKKLKKTGHILLAAGGGAVLTGILIGANADGWSGAGTGALIFVAGVGSSIASIPLFITAHNHKKKAELIMSAGNLGLQGGTLYESGYASVSLRIGF